MTNDILFFRLYILIILVFLLIFSFVLSKQLFIIVINQLKLIFLSSKLQKKNNFNEDFYCSLLEIYLINDNIVISVALSEFVLELNNDLVTKDLIYASLAYSYYSNSFYSIAEYYYLKILSFAPSNYKAISNLAYLYYNLGYKTKANYLFVRARNLEPTLSDII
uniref:hypothetical protein Ycf37 n=1 Tax=Lophurella stichidiosa TaxID=2008659 RepID=UPI002551D1E7|nr:hypothetical protein Ycf37 [Aphanocladia stichidiosa]WGH13992.1 hypothetical protein Ycf37 [Aphanocladia stichidiosa]